MPGQTTQDRACVIGNPLWHADCSAARLGGRAKRGATDDHPPAPQRALYAGLNARALEKAKTLPADGVILDLEDSVAPDAKETARAQVADAVKAGGFGAREVFIRVNGVDTPGMPRIFPPPRMPRPMRSWCRKYRAPRRWN